MRPALDYDVIGLTNTPYLHQRVEYGWAHAVGTAAKCAGVRMRCFIRTIRLKRLHPRKIVLAENGHRPVAGPGMWHGHLVLRVI